MEVFGDKMKFGVMANPAKDIVEEIKKIGQMGFDFVEITFEPPKCMVNDIFAKRSEILKALEDYNMFAVGHLGWWANFGEAYPAVRDAWIYEMKKVLEVCSYLGITKQNLHLYATGIENRIPEFQKAILDRYVSSLNELVKEAKKYDIKLMIENADDTFSNKANLSYLFKKVKGLNFHLDTGHAMLFGKGMDGVKELLFAFKNKLEHIHIHDNHARIDDEHLPIGVANFDYQMFAKMLKKIKYNKTLTFEVFTRDQDYLKFCLEKFKGCLV